MLDTIKIDKLNPNLYKKKIYSVEALIIAPFKSSTSDTGDVQGVGCHVCNNQLSVWFCHVYG